MSFAPPVINYYTRETENGRSLFSRTADCKKYSPRSIGETQQRQKKNYDKSATASHLSEGDLCRLKVLSGQNKEPFRIQSLTVTNAIIWPMNNCNGEAINVSRQ